MIYNYNKLTPFKKYIIQNFPFIDADFDALTNYQLYCKIVEYLNKVIDSENEQNEQIELLTNAFNNLHDYVENYFANLDVQEEIDNKLDDMVEQGTLQEIVADYLNSKAVFGYDNVQAMKDSTNLINGSYAKTLGFYSKNDNGGAYYKIRNITNDDVVDNMKIISLNDENNQLIAELIIQDFVNPEMFGAKSDGESDDKNYIQACFNSKCKRIHLDGNYYISDSVKLIGSEIIVTGKGKITCDNQNPAVILNLIDSSFSIDTIEAVNCIQLSTTEQGMNVIQYLKLHDMILNASNKCIEAINTSGKWINEIFFNNIRFNGAFGFYFMTQSINSGFRFVECANESCTDTFVKGYCLNQVEMYSIRNQESVGYKFIDISNQCDYLYINTADPIRYNMILLPNSSTSSYTKGLINADIRDDGLARVGPSAIVLNKNLIIPNMNKFKILYPDQRDNYNLISDTDIAVPKYFELSYAEGGHAYTINLGSAGIPIDNVPDILIGNFSGSNTLAITIENRTLNINFSASGLGSGLYKLVRYSSNSGVIYRLIKLSSTILS